MNQTGKSREYISNASGYPPDDLNCKFTNNSSEIGKSRSFVSTASAYPPDPRQINCNNNNNYNNNNDTCDSKMCLSSEMVDSVFNDCKIELSLENYPTITTNSDNRHVFSMQLSENSISNQYSAYRSNGNFIDTNVQLLNANSSSNEYLSALTSSKGDIIRHASDLNIYLTQEIESKNRKWWITVPVRKLDASIEYIRLLADPGANIGCVNTKWAIERYKDFIVKNNKTHTIDTPNGKVHPEYAIYLKFPTKTGDYYRAKFVLLDDLPTPILADINMLEAFGYKFRDEIPPIFSHPAQFDLDLNIRTNDKYLVHSYPCDSESKENSDEFDSDDLKESEKLTKNEIKMQQKMDKNAKKDTNSIYHIYKLNKINNFDDSGHIPLISKVANDSETIMFDESYKHSIFATNDFDFINDYNKSTKM